MKKIIHKSPTQTIFEDGTSIRKTNKESWIEEFDTLYQTLILPDYEIVYDRLKQFILKTIEEQNKQLKDWITMFLQRNIDERDLTYEEQSAYNQGYVDCLEDLITYIKTL